MGFAVPENDPVLGAPAPPIQSATEPHTPAQRLGAVADALGTSPLRLVLGAVGGLLLAAVVAWTLLATPSAGGGRADDDALPRAASASSSSPSAPAASPAARSLVYVAGAVVAPGVYRLGGDARVADALAAAGGAAPDADLAVLNLAAPVADGERVYVPRKGEVPLDAAGLAGGFGGSGSGSGGAGTGARAGPLNLNTATVEQLEALPGIGPSTAQAIVAWRRQHGRFRKVDDLLNVRGIGPAKLDAIRALVMV